MAKPRESGWIPFSDGQPVEEGELEAFLGGDGAAEREHPPADTSSGGGDREVPPETDNESILFHIEQALGCELIWELADALEKFHNDRRHRDRRGRRREYKLIDMIIVEIAIFYYGSRLGAVRNLNDQPTWNRLRKAARRAFPKSRFPKRKARQARRLSPTGPSRRQNYRARKEYFSGAALDYLQRGYRRTALQAAISIGLLDPAAGTWTDPHKTQLVAGDMTWMQAATRYHRDEPFHPKTGKGRRLDVNADFHNRYSEHPGRELVMLSCRGGQANERILLDAEFMERKKSTRRCRNEAHKAVDMLKRLTAENPDLTSGVRGLAHDMAAQSQEIDEILDAGFVPMVKVPKVKGGRLRNHALGPHDFTTPSGAIARIDVNTLNGSTWIWVPGGQQQKRWAVPLDRKQLRWKKTNKRHLASLVVAIPNHPLVPHSLQGATTTVRLNSTPQEIHNDPHTRRTRSLRPCPEADPAFAAFGAREDIESTFSDFKYRTRKKLTSTYEDDNRFHFIAYMLMRLSRALSAYHKHTATTATHAIPIAA